MEAARFGVRVGGTPHAYLHIWCPPNPEEPKKYRHSYKLCLYCIKGGTVQAKAW